MRRIYSSAKRTNTLIAQNNFSQPRVFKQIIDRFGHFAVTVADFRVNLPQRVFVSAEEMRL
jgi:hypothetical protein